jgi:hypothetical protein
VRLCLEVCEIYSGWQVVRKGKVQTVSLHHYLHCSVCSLVALLQVFSAFGFVQKIAIFEKQAGFQALVQYPGKSEAPFSDSQEVCKRSFCSGFGGHLITEFWILFLEGLKRRLNQSQDTLLRMGCWWELSFKPPT